MQIITLLLRSDCNMASSVLPGGPIGPGGPGVPGWPSDPVTGDPGRPRAPGIPGVPGSPAHTQQATIQSDCSGMTSFKSLFLIFNTQESVKKATFGARSTIKSRSSR